jgi:hypothetical protein
MHKEAPHTPCPHHPGARPRSVDGLQHHGEAGRKLKAGKARINFFLESDPNSWYSPFDPLGASFGVCLVLFAKPTYTKEAFLSISYTTYSRRFLPLSNEKAKYGIKSSLWISRWGERPQEGIREDSGPGIKVRNCSIDLLDGSKI